MKKMKKFLFSILCHISPKFATQILFYKRLRTKLNLNSPKTFNEKLQWLKLNKYNDNKLVTICADKHAVRKYIHNLGLDHLLNEIYYTWDNEKKIAWNKLPEKFVLKCNHGAGYNIICNNKNSLDIKQTQKTLKKWMQENYWINTVELCYKNINKRIICEKLIETESGSLPYDYKVFCFDGTPKFVMVCTERETQKPKYYFMTENWEILPYGLDYQNIKNTPTLQKPQGFEKLFKYAKKLSEPFPFVRVDFYLDNGNVIFGELTFTPAAGYDLELNTPENPHVDLEIGKLLKLK
ncbi:ATP-grasp fold amidoligase family protein [Xenorhabdus anantnagensis]|uniref:ATP-grasp fold amidoligase family protein n=1 Tax=Xenorhabdus anantnagensis TaxID=3025875 RepID=A0ABT5LSQ4_9GAMM|nr:ATP-grasp fold amidoligase family protein [Xenorhabdus anantnagensis]MDC9596808.1 ATP-grasp fold amidoligase family protein [Xenorhabdus anantnagensis]